MAGPSTMLSSSATPAHKPYVSGPTSATTSTLGSLGSRPSLERDGGGLQGRSASSVSFAARGGTLKPGMAGSFSSELRSQASASRNGFGLEKLDEDDDAAKAEMVGCLREALAREMKIKEGSENMLEALKDKKIKHIKEQKQRVEAELTASNDKIKHLRQKIADAQRAKAAPATPTRPRGDGLQPSGAGERTPASLSRSGAGSEADEATESPTYALAEMLQALEVDGMGPDYYVSRANGLVDLFKRHATLKYELIWSVFGLRMQVMLTSESREVVAAGYRMMRYAMTDLTSLRKIRALNTDYLVAWSLAKDRKADVEREQALKFVRGFLDIKDGVGEISRAVVRAIAAVAEESEERLRPICLETLAEMLVRDPRLLLAAGGIGPLHAALGDGSYKAADSVAAAFVYLLDSPERRQYLRPGNELEILFTAFTDEMTTSERILKQAAKAVGSALKTWSGLMSLCMYDFRAIRSMISSMVVRSGPIRETVLDLLHSLLRIKSPTWAASFLAGRRLTTYGRVSNLRRTSTKGAQAEVEDETGEQSFVDHYTALLLAVFVKAGMVPALVRLAQVAEDGSVKRKSTLLVAEVLGLADRLLPPSWSAELQLLPELFEAAARLSDPAHFSATGTVYQISSVSRTLHRSAPTSCAPPTLPSANSRQPNQDDQSRANAASNLDDATFRQMLVDSGVLSSSNFAKWKWDVVQKIIEAPLLNSKRFEEASKASKFLKRIMSFYRPFKYRFSDIRSTRSSQKYVRAGCALMHSLLQTPEGVKYLSDNKLLRQIAECLAQCDPTSGLTAQYPVFSRDRLTDTLCGGYFPMLGVLTGDVRGMQMLDRWRIFNMLYHVIDLQQRPDLVKLMLANFDYGLPGHPRVLLSKALTAGTKDSRISATNALRKCATCSSSAAIDSKWAIELLVTQLYDPELEVCATAVKILEKACNAKNQLEYIVECRPALDHLGEIGAPLLLRFLSTSIGYHYLDGLDYISNEMDDWFLGRNDAYVSVIEASLARSFLDQQDDHTSRLSVFDDEHDMELDSHVPPHFYRELTRTTEGCTLLREKGHFQDFADTIRQHGMQSDDAEAMVKVKGCLWAVGNVGSMALGAPFLDACGVVDCIVRIAQEHRVMSLRGTAFFVLGLISRSVHGLEMLSEHGWDAKTNSIGHSLGFCIPNDLGCLFSLRPWRHVPAVSVQLPASQQTETAPLPPMPSRPRSESLRRAIEEEGGPATVIPAVQLDPNPTNQRILELVMDMATMVPMLYRRARVELMQIKAQKKAAGFGEPHLFRRVMSLLERCHHRLADRNLIVSLFDRSVLRSIVFGANETDLAFSPKRVVGPSTWAVAVKTDTAPPPPLRTHSEDGHDDDNDHVGAHDQEEQVSRGDQHTERLRSLSDPGESERGLRTISQMHEKR